MPIPDLSGLTLTELGDLIQAATAAYRTAEQAAQDDEAQRRTQIGAAIGALEALLGPESTAPYDPATGENATINGVLKHDTTDHAVLEQNAGLALSLILNGMRVTVSTVLNLARVIADTKET